jgi:HK97 gp10 family phage protein
VTRVLFFVMALNSRLDNIARALDEEIDTGIKRAADQIALDAKARVPVNTGALRDAIHVERVDVGQYAVVAGDGRAVFYGHMVENGTIHQPARPFLTPAYEAQRPNIDALVKAALKDL